MPFIPNSERRGLVANPAQATKPGHLAFIIYTEMMRRWNAEPGWTTADQIHLELVLRAGDCHYLDSLFSQARVESFDKVVNATYLSWQVFFMKVVWPYEQAKCRENGDIL